MANEEVIRRIRTIFTQEGVEGVARAYGLMAEGEERVTRSSLSLNRAFENLERRYNKDLALQQQYARHQEQINAAVAQNPALQNRAADTLARMEKEYGKAAVANDNFTKSTKATRYELINLSRQVQDVFVSIASGQKLGTVGLQQGTQIFDVFASSSQGAKGLLKSITALLTPTVLLGAGLAALAAGGVAAVSMWKSYALALDDVSKASGLSVDNLSRLQSAAGFKGISTSEFSAGITKFAQGVSEASTRTGELYKLFRLNGLEVGNTEESLKSVSDLIRKSSDEQQKLRILQQAGLPATAEWVRYLEGGRETLEKMKKDAEEFGGLTNDNMVKTARDFQEAWDKAWINFGVSVRRTVYEAFDLLTKLDLKGNEAIAAFDKMTGGRGEYTVGVNLLKAGYGQRLSNDLSTLYGGFESSRGLRSDSATRKVIDTQAYAAQRQDLQFTQQRIGLLGDLATVQDKVAAKTQEINLVRILNTKITDEDAKKVLDLYRAEETYAKHAAAVSALGEGATEAEKYALKVEALNIAQQKGYLTQEQYNRALAYANPLFSGIASTLESGITSSLTDVVSGTKTAKDAFNDFLASTLKAIEQLIIKLLIVEPLVKQLASGIGGSIGSFNLFGSANGNVFQGGNVVPFARGGVVTGPTLFPMANGAGLMGEAGPEAVMPLKRGSDGRLGVISANSNKAPVNNINITNNVGGQVSTSERTNASGGKDIEIIFDRLLNDRLASGRADKAMSRYGSRVVTG